MKIREQTARVLLKALGFDNADAYSPAVLSRRLARVEEVTEEFRLVAVSQGKHAAVLKAVLNAGRRKEVIEVIDLEEPPESKQFQDNMGATDERDGGKGFRQPLDVDQEADEMAPVLEQRGASVHVPRKEQPQPDPRPLPVNRRAVERADAKPGPAIVRRERDEDEFDGYEPTPLKPHRPGGIMRTVFDLVRAASEQSPITKDEVWRSLKVKFPDRDPHSLRATVNQFPNWIPKYYPFAVHERGKKHWWLTPKLLQKARETRDGAR